MDVLIVSRGIPSESYPLLGIFEMDQAQALAQNGVRPIVFAIDLRSIRRKRTFGMGHEVHNGIKCYYCSLPIGRVPKSILNAIGKCSFSILYHRVLRGKKPDIIHAHFAEQGYYAAGIAERYQIPFVITEHSSHMAKKQISRSLLKTAKKAYHSADQVVAVGNALADNIELNTGFACEVIPNIVDVNQFVIKKQRDDGQFKFISVGRLIPLKQMDILIDAFAKVKCSCPQATLDIFGDGEEKEKLQKKIEQSSLVDSVVLHGAVMREDIANALAQSDCFVLLSKSETFGVAFIEAMAAGLPVIGLKCGGPEEFVRENTGCLIDQNANTNQEVVNQMINMCMGKRKYDSQEIREYVSSMYGSDVIANKLKRLYETVL